jgi:HEPN domain-containing protein
MTRQQLQQLTRIRLREARLLLDNNNSNGAYYLAGYSVEFALKACISRRIKQNEIPDKKLIQDIYTHNLRDLVKLADLENQRVILERANANFATNWAIVKDWNESSRYKMFSQTQAQELYNSISARSRNGGILAWIRQYW